MVGPTDEPGTNLAFVPITASFTATGTTSVLTFTVRDDPGYLYVTDVSVTAVPKLSTWAMIAVGVGLLGATARRHPHRLHLSP